MRTLITGGTGFIGRSLIGELSRRGEELIILCRKGTDCPGYPIPGTTILHGDILDRASIDRAMRGCRRVYHLAGFAKNWAKDPSVYALVNVDGLRNVLESAIGAGVKRVVWTSSAVTPGPSNGSPVTEWTRREHSFYTDYERSKFMAEHMVRGLLNRGTEIITVNPTRVFGPGILNEGNSVTRMVSLYLAGKFRFIPGDGTAVGNYAFVDDVARGMMLAMESGKNGERYLLGGENRSYNEFFRTVSALSGTERRMFHLPGRLAIRFARVEEFRSRFGHHPLITPGWVRTFLADWAVSVDRSRKELGYRPTPFAEAMTHTIRWIHQKGGVS